MARLFPLATVVTPNLAEARALAGCRPSSGASSPSGWSSSARRAAIVTGGHGEPVDHLFDGARHVEIPVERLDVARDARRRLHALRDAGGAARTRLSLDDAARGAARAATDAVRHGLVELGAGDGPVDILNVKGRA